MPAGQVKMTAQPLNGWAQPVTAMATIQPTPEADRRDGADILSVQAHLGIKSYQTSVLYLVNGLSLGVSCSSFIGMPRAQAISTIEAAVRRVVNISSSGSIFGSYYIDMDKFRRWLNLQYELITNACTGQYRDVSGPRAAPVPVVAPAPMRVDVLNPVNRASDGKTYVPYSAPLAVMPQPVVVDQSFYQTYAAKGIVPAAQAMDTGTSPWLQLLILGAVGYAGYAYGESKRRAAK